jgi:ribosomal protein RSM22 (predicted rRNA methylase)
MKWPESLQTATEQILQKSSPSVLKRASEALTQEYRQKHSSHSIFSDEARRLAYLAVRFPATYAAVTKVLSEIPEIPCKKILDLGAGPGTAAWAARELFPDIQETVLIEKSASAVSLGKELMGGSDFKARWICEDLETMTEFPSADLAILSYALGELKNPNALVEKLWQNPISYLAIIEPGTPLGYRNIVRARELLIHLGAYLLAPCPHRMACPLKTGDWCHFSVRLERTKLHRLLKEGSLGYEDEKFSYLIVSRQAQKIPGSRILRPPQKGSGHVRFSICNENGACADTVVSRKTKDFYRLARDAEWGDRWM